MAVVELLHGLLCERLQTGEQARTTKESLAFARIPMPPVSELMVDVLWLSLTLTLLLIFAALCGPECS